MIHISPGQFQAYQRQWTGPVAAEDREGQRSRTNAAYWVAYCYRKSPSGNGGVTRNISKARRILEQAIEEQDRVTDNNSNTHDNTGKHRYVLADQFELVGQRANQLYHQAFQRLEAEAQERGGGLDWMESTYYLGCALYHGNGVEKDPRQAIHLWKMAAELGHGPSQNMLSCRCLNDKTGTHARSIFGWLQQMAIQHKHAWAQRILGCCYRHGLCCLKKDLVQAVEWYNKAIAQGDERAPWCKSCLLSHPYLSAKERNHVLSCVERNKKIEKVMLLLQQPPNSIPLGLWARVMGSFQNQENSPWEAPSPTFLALCSGVAPLFDIRCRKGS